MAFREWLPTTALGGALVAESLRGYPVLEAFLTLMFASCERTGATVAARGIQSAHRN